MGKGHQMMQRMGWKGQGLGSQESGITEPISGGEVRDKQDQYKGMGIEKDPFEDFRKMRAGGYYKRVKDTKGNRREIWSYISDPENMICLYHQWIYCVVN